VPFWFGVLPVSRKQLPAVRGLILARWFGPAVHVPPPAMLAVLPSLPNAFVHQYVCACRFGLLVIVTGRYALFFLRLPPATTLRQTYDTWFGPNAHPIILSLKDRQLVLPIQFGRRLTLFGMLGFV